MTSDETMASHSQVSVMHEDEDYDDVMEDGYDQSQNHLHPNPHKYLSRLSTCCSSKGDEDTNDHDDEDGSMDVYHNISRLSIESFDGGADADEELSDDKEEEGNEQLLWGISSSDSDKETGFSSLPATPPRRKRPGHGGSTTTNMNHHLLLVGIKEYASENDAQNGLRLGQKKKSNPKRRRSKLSKERWAESGVYDGLSGESEGGLVVITRPKGGGRSLCMDLEEVKACRDLGFELEHQRMLEMPSRLSLSASNLDTSSGGNSPISSMRISSPGDDPRDVKARLKVWAQAVAIASTSKHSI